MPFYELDQWFINVIIFGFRLFLFCFCFEKPNNLTNWDSLYPALYFWTFTKLCILYWVLSFRQFVGIDTFLLGLNNKLDLSIQNIAKYCGLKGFTFYTKSRHAWHIIVTLKLRLLEIIGWINELRSNTSSYLQYLPLFGPIRQLKAFCGEFGWIGSAV